MVDSKFVQGNCLVLRIQERADGWPINALNSSNVPAQVKLAYICLCTKVPSLVISNREHIAYMTDEGCMEADLLIARQHNYWHIRIKSTVLRCIPPFPRPCCTRSRQQLDHGELPEDREDW